MENHNYIRGGCGHAAESLEKDSRFFEVFFIIGIILIVSLTLI